jgi:hypothetical protein
MSDEELCKSLRSTLWGQGHHINIKAADRIEALTAKLAKAVEALREAVYLLDPDEEDIAKETGLYRIVTTLAEIEGEKG